MSDYPNRRREAIGLVFICGTLVGTLHCCHYEHQVLKNRSIASIKSTKLLAKTKPFSGFHLLLRLHLREYGDNLKVST